MLHVYLNSYFIEANDSYMSETKRNILGIIRGSVMQSAWVLQSEKELALILAFTIYKCMHYYCIKGGKIVIWGPSFKVK